MKTKKTSGNALVRLLIIILIATIIISGYFIYSRGTTDIEIKNILLISIDTCRADRLSCYGYRRNTTPNIDALASEGVLFKNAVSPVPLTLPAHSSMLTGTIPPYHGVHNNTGYKLFDNNETLAEILQKRGFSTGAVIGACVLDSLFGLDQGFDKYDDEFDEEFQTFSFAERKGAEVSRHGVGWLDKHKDERFFLFLHYFDPHRDWIPPEPFTSKYFGDPYAGEIAYVDDCIGRVIEKLKSLDLYESTMIIITADHGEGLGEHVEQGHGFLIYQDTLHVPLVIRLPGGTSNRSVSGRVGLVDIVPTVLDILKIPIPAHIQGRSLLGCLLRKRPSLKDADYYCESFISTMYDCNPLLGMVTGRWKYIQNVSSELYDLETDPGELKNLLDEHPHRARIMQDKIKEAHEKSRHGEANSKISVSSETIKNLESLGYVLIGEIDESFEMDLTKENAKDLVKFADLNSLSTNLMGLEKYSEAKPMCEKMLEMRPEYSRAYLNLGSIAFAEGDIEKSESYFSQYIRTDPNDPQLYWNLGLTYYYQDRYTEAIEQFEKALGLDPDFTDVYYNLGAAYMRAGKVDQAIQQWKTLLEMNTGYSQKVHIELAKVYFSQGKKDEAIFHWNESLKLDPDDPKVHSSLAETYRLQGKIEKSLVYWKRSLSLDPDQPQVCNRIAELVVTRGRIEEAVRYWKATLELEPDWPRVLNNLGWIMATSTNEKLFNPKDALQYAAKACELTKYEDPETLDTLGAAYAAKGEFDKATQTAQKAGEIFSSRGMEKKAEQARSRLELYKTGKAYRE